MAKDHGPQIKDDATYEALRKGGASKEKAARIANATANPKMHPSEKGGHAKPYDDWTKAELYRQAKELGVEGRSGMTKGELIETLQGR